MSENGMDRPCSRPTSEHARGAIEQKEHHAMPRKSNTAVATIGIDPGKNTLHLVGLDARGGIVLREKVARTKIGSRLANVPSCLIGIEAGMGTHYVTRELLALHHDVRQVPPVYAKPFRQTHKNDFRDAHAVAEAVQRPTTRYFRAAEHRGDEIAHGIGRRSRPCVRLLLGLIVSRYCFGTLDEQAGIDAQSPTNQSEYHNGTNAKPTASAGNASKTSATTIFNAVASG